MTTPYLQRINGPALSLGSDVKWTPKPAPYDARREWLRFLFVVIGSAIGGVCLGVGCAAVALRSLK